MKIHIADKSVLARVLIRKKRQGNAVFEVDLDVVLREILAWANRLVPSESGSILLDDPVLKLEGRKKGRLFFSACFGKGSASLVGTSITDGWGVAGETYRRGKPCISKDVKRDERFYAKIDEKTGFCTQSIICAPIVIEGSTIGVIELINKKGRINFDRNDLFLLEIFAGYTATLIQNALIARNFEELSKRDNLTNLYNDRYFFHSLELCVKKAIREGGDLTLIFFDLDHFKEVNDNHGHLAGSRVLKEVSDIMRKIFRDTNCIMARFGGDEYVVVLPDTDSATAAVYAEGLRKGIEDYTFLRKKTSGVVPACNLTGLITCSIGIASMSGKGRSGSNIRQLAGALIRAADGAMYTAKETGKNRVFIEGQVCADPVKACSKTKPGGRKN